MSFICTKCGPKESGKQRILVPTKIREVVYKLQTKTIFANGSNIKTANSAKGSEIVEEKAYCRKCVPEKIEPIVVEKTIREQIVKTIFRLRKSLEEKKEEEE